MSIIRAKDIVNILQTTYNLHIHIHVQCTCTVYIVHLQLTVKIWIKPIMDFFILYSHLSIGLDRTVCPETRRYEDLGIDYYGFFLSTICINCWPMTPQSLLNIACWFEWANSWMIDMNKHETLSDLQCQINTLVSQNNVDFAESSFAFCGRAEYCFDCFFQEKNILVVFFTVIVGSHS